MKTALSIEGGYHISYFEMSLHTLRCDLTPAKMSMKDFSVWLHEYVHFIQDLSTYYGLNSLYVECEYIRECVSLLRSNTKRAIPIDKDLLSHQTKVNKEIIKQTWGYSFPQDNLNIRGVKIIPKELDCGRIVSTIELVTDSTEKVYFGAHCITESMAYIVERLCCPHGYVNSPQYPYEAAEKVTEFIVPGMAKDLSVVLALCDMSLQYSNPGKVFLNSLYEIKNKKLVIGKAEDVYDHFYQENGFFKEFHSIQKVVNQCVKGYNVSNNFGNNFNIWVDNFTDFATDWRNKDKYFLLKMIREPNIQESGCLGKVLHDCGTPIIKNEMEFYYKISPHNIENAEWDVEFFKTILQIKELFESGEKVCSLKIWCKNSPNNCINVDDRCSNSPWSRAKDTILCPYAITWKIFGLEDCNVDF